MLGKRLVAALIRAGFVVDGSWPIQTEMGKPECEHDFFCCSVLLSLARVQETTTCGSVRVGTTPSLMTCGGTLRRNSTTFWDAGIRGPDFVWAATGPALGSLQQAPGRQEGNRSG